MNVRYRVELSQADRCELGALLNGGRQSARKLKRAQQRAEACRVGRRNVPRADYSSAEVARA